MRIEKKPGATLTVKIASADSSSSGPVAGSPFLRCGMAGKAQIRQTSDAMQSVAALLSSQPCWNSLCWSHGVVPPRDIKQRLFLFACRAVDIYRHLTADGGAGRVLAPQFLEAATSVASNMEEADAAASARDFVAKANISLKEARESHFWLRLFIHCGIGDPLEIGPAEREANELVAIITTIVRKTRARITAGA